MPSGVDLARSRIFDGLSDRERRSWMARGRAREFSRGQIVARQGEPARELYLVGSGFLKVVQLTPEGQQLIVRFVGPGEPFGGVVALDGAEYPVTAIAVEPSGLHAWSLDALRPLLEDTPQVRVNIMREMTAHMTDALTRVRELATTRVGPRLANALVRLMRQCGRPTADGVALAHCLTRQELAELTGTTLYTVSRTLSQWTHDGVLRTTGRRLIIRAPKKLEALAKSNE